MAIGRSTPTLKIWAKYSARVTRVLGRDKSVRGLLRVTLAPTLATHLLMPDFADVARSHPDIWMDIMSYGDLANLTNLEADVAVRQGWE